MSTSKPILLRLAAVLLCSVLSDAFSYEDIQKLNASCLPKDTCSVPRDLDHSDHHNCDCSSLCALYDTCCIDSPFLNNSNKYEIHASCRSTSQGGDHLFMVDTCPDSYDGQPALRRRCEQNGKDWSDPFNNVPLTNPSTQKTYRSLFCAICNGENPRQLVMWQIILDCTLLKGNMNVCVEDRDFVLSNMMYIREKGVWGLWSYEPESDWKFRYLTINFKIPESIKKFVKRCRPNLVSECHPSWKNQKYTRLCQSYMGVVYFPNTTYRNIHCALCNYETNITQLSCHDNKNLDFKGQPMNFGVLLDFDLSDGLKVGTVAKACTTDQVYDPFAKRCRNIECPLPGFTLSEGKCIPEAEGD